MVFLIAKKRTVMFFSMEYFASTVRVENGTMPDRQKQKIGCLRRGKAWQLRPQSRGKLGDRDSREGQMLPPTGGEFVGCLMVTDLEQPRSDTKVIMKQGDGR